MKGQVFLPRVPSFFRDWLGTKKKLENLVPCLSPGYKDSILLLLRSIDWDYKVTGIQGFTSLECTGEYPNLWNGQHPADNFVIVKYTDLWILSLLEHSDTFLEIDINAQVLKKKTELLYFRIFLIVSLPFQLSCLFKN